MFCSHRFKCSFYKSKGNSILWMHEYYNLTILKTLQYWNTFCMNNTNWQQKNTDITNITWVTSQHFGYSFVLLFFRFFFCLYCHLPCIICVPCLYVFKWKCIQKKDRASVHKNIRIIHIQLSCLKALYCLA